MFLYYKSHYDTLTSGSMNEPMDPAQSQADFPSTPRDLSIRSGDDFGAIHRHDSSPTRNVPDERFTAYSYWPGDIRGQNSSQQQGRENTATHDFPDPQLRSPLEQRFTSYSYWPGESFGEIELQDSQDAQDAQDLSDLQVRIPLEERFTSYWWGGVVDESYHNQRQQSRYDLGNAYNAEIEMIQSPSDQRLAMQATGPVCCTLFENIMRPSAAANQAFCLGSYQKPPIPNLVQ